MAQSESETVLTEHHETDNLDPRTDAPARPGTPVHIAPVQLGNITVPTPVVLSPMAGVTNWPFRVICEEYGPDGLYVAEMITARASWRITRKHCASVISPKAKKSVQCSCTA